MDNLNIEIKTKILEFLKGRKYGASSSEIAKSIGHNRITVTKYLEIMKAHKLLAYDDVAQAKLWYIAEKNTRKKILVVDDEQHIVTLVKLILQNYEIHGAYSGLEALEKIKKEVPDIIILDLMMPGLTGYEVCQRLKANALTQHIPIIILSAKGELNDKLKGVKVGADDYLTKPFDPMELEAKISFLLRNEDNTLTNPLTLLPSTNSLKIEINNRIKAKQNFSICIVEISDLDKFTKDYGAKKRAEVIKMLAIILQEKTKEQGSYLAHTIKDNFVMITTKKDIGDITSSFKHLLPYIFHGTSKLSLNIVKVYSRKENLESALSKIYVK